MSDLPIVTYQCVICGYVDDTPELVRSHITVEHMDADKNDWDVRPCIDFSTAEVEP